jgi:formyltetrahydrofolate-dependent phosphoribosylglycinamide formyltransferase
MAKRLVVLASGEGTLLQSMIDAQASVGPDHESGGALGARIVAVGADRDDIPALRRAQAAGIGAFTCRVSDYPDRTRWDEALTRTCAEFEPDLVVSAGFRKLLGDKFLAEFGGRCVNSHPALLPSFPGLFGVKEALRYGVKVTGCTVFLVDHGMDSGPVIAQEAVRVREDDDEESLQERVKTAERELLVSAVRDMMTKGWSVNGRRVRIGGV